MPDGRPYPSGTAYEVLTAIEARRTKNLPDVYVFRYAEPPTVALDDREHRSFVEEQWERLKGFFDQWFVSPEGQFKAAFHVFSSTDEFEDQAERLLRQWIEEHVLSDRAVSWPVEIKGSPFRGLDAFDTQHAAVFFGRSRDIARSIDALKGAAERGTPYLLLVGPSGTGKSSLARAGLVPRLTAAGVVPSVDLWRVAVFRPAERGSDPFFAFADELLNAARGGAFDDTQLKALPELASWEQHRTPRQLAEYLRTSDAPADPIRAALDAAAEAERSAGGYDRAVSASLLVVADQLDELFAADIPGETRERFGALLTQLAASGRVWIVATLRADLYERYMAVPTLLALKTEGAAYDLAPPGPAELAEIVRRPVEAANLVYEADANGRTLDERLLAEAGRADMLPLLQFTLNRLFEERVVADGEMRLTHAAYEAIGGLSGAIDQEAERALAGLRESAIERLPRLLRDLATPAKGGEGDGASDAALTIRSVPLLRAAHDVQARQLIQALIDARILLSSGGEAEPTIRIAHQRVLESWQRARGIVAENAEFFRIRQEVEDERRRWEEGGRKRDRLIRPGVPLAEAESISQRFRDELPPETRAFVQASGSRARLRQRLTAAAAIVFLGVAIAAGYLGWRASVAEEEARRNYLTARNTVDTIVFDVAQGLRDVEGMRIESIRTILREVEKAVQELEQSVPNEAGLFRSRATMMMLYGDVYRDAGDSRAALAAYEEALAASQILLREGPEDLEARRDVLVDLVRVADARHNLGEIGGAAANYGEALEIARDLVEADPDKVLWRRDLMMVLQRIGDMQTRVGSLDAAEATMQEALATGRAALDLEPGNQKTQEDIGVALERIGDLHVRAGDLAEALATHQEGLGLRRAISDAEPGNTQRQRGVASSLSKVGDVKLQTGEMPAALADFEEALAILRHLARLDEENVRVLADMSVLVSKVGEVALKRGDFESTLAAYEESLAISRRLAEMEPDRLEWQRNVSIDLNRIGDLRVRTGDVPDALATYEEALAVMRGVSERDPENVDWRRDVVVSLGKVADTEARLGNEAESRAAHEEALEIARRLAAQEPDNPQWQADVAFSLERIGGGRLRAGDAEGAMAAYSESADILRSLAEAHPENLAWRRNFAVTLGHSGDLMLRTGDVEGALAAYEEQLSINRTMAEASPDNTERQRDLAVSLNRVADAKRRAGDADGALAGYEEALEISRQLAAADPGNVLWQQDIAFSLNRVADTHAARGDSTEAAAGYEEALAIARRLSAAYPDTPVFREDVAFGLQRLADVRAGELDVEAALALYEEELAIRRELSGASPQNVEHRRHVAISLMRVGDVRAYQGDRAAALALLEEALAILRELTVLDPANQVWQTNLMAAYLKIADASENPRRLEMLGEALPIAVRLEDAGALSGELAGLPARIRERLAE